MTQYLRYPHLARDLITFTAEDDVWQVAEDKRFELLRGLHPNTLSKRAP